MAARQRVRHDPESIEVVYYSLQGSRRLHDVEHVTVSPEVVRGILRRLERALAASRYTRPPRAVAEMIADFATAMMPGVANVEIASVLIAAARLTTDAYRTAEAESLRLLATTATGDTTEQPLDRMERVLDEPTDGLD
jgi:DNA-binding GntR family transcriptional regulator